MMPGGVYIDSDFLHRELLMRLVLYPAFNDRLSGGGRCRVISQQLTQDTSSGSRCLYLCPALLATEQPATADLLGYESPVFGS